MPITPTSATTSTVIRYVGLVSNAPAKVRVTARACARLEPQISAATESIRKASPYDHPYWHLERARIGESRNVPIELIVNGVAVQRKEMEADGSVCDVQFDVNIAESSWLGLRIFPSSHTNPIFIKIADRPVRASKKSAQWCRQCVDVCWEQKKLRIRDHEISAAQAAYDHARSVYDRIISESAV